MNYKLKYNKYKNKYLKLKSLLQGGLRKGAHGRYNTPEERAKAVEDARNKKHKNREKQLQENSSLEVSSFKNCCIAFILSSSVTTVLPSSYFLVSTSPPSL